MGKWKMSTIGESCELINGGTPKTKIEKYWGGAYAWITPAEMGGLESPYMAYTRRTLTEDGLASTSARLLPPYSVIVSSRAPIGYLVINEVPMATNQGCKGLVPGPELNYKYLYYFLYSRVEVLNALGTGATFKELSATKLKTVPIPLPPLDEQERIVAILDEAFAAIDIAVANTQKNLENAKELFEGYLDATISALQDEWLSVDAVCNSIIDCINKTAPHIDAPTPYRMIRTTNVRDGSINLSSVRYVSKATYEAWTRRQVPQAGDVILTREAPMGEVGMLGEVEGIFLGQRLVSYRTDPEKMSPRFLLYTLRSKALQDQIKQFGSGSTVQHMRVPDSKRLKVPCPEISKQDALVDSISAVESYVDQLTVGSEKKLTLLAELKQSLLSRAFSGKLTGAEVVEE